MFSRRILAIAALSVAPAFAQTEAPQEEPYQLDEVQTTATREREIVVRTVLAGLKRNKSDRPEDSETIACEKSKRTGTSITTILCGKNRTWLALGAASKRDNSMVFAMVPDGMAPGTTPANRLMPMLIRASSAGKYNARLDTELMEFDLSLLLNQDQFPGDIAEQDARIDQLLEHERRAKQAEDEAFVRFVLAWNGVRRTDASAAPGCTADPVCDKAHAAALEQAIIDAGLNVQQYNASVLRLEIDPQFRSRVVAALQRPE